MVPTLVIHLKTVSDEADLCKVQLRQILSPARHRFQMELAFARGTGLGGGLTCAKRSSARVWPPRLMPPSRASATAAPTAGWLWPAMPAVNSPTAAAGGKLNCFHFLSSNCATACRFE